MGHDKGCSFFDLHFLIFGFCLCICVDQFAVRVLLASVGTQEYVIHCDCVRQFNGSWFCEAVGPPVRSRWDVVSQGGVEPKEIVSFRRGFVELSVFRRFASFGNGD